MLHHTDETDGDIDELDERTRSWFIWQLVPILYELLSDIFGRILIGLLNLI